MILSGIKIQKLFSQFDYDIVFNHEEGITILTGPNGYGKTTILNIIDSLFNQSFFYFQKLKFDSIIVSFYDGKQLKIGKTKHGEPYLSDDNGGILATEDSALLVLSEDTIEIKIDLMKKNEVIETFVYKSTVEDVSQKTINLVTEQKQIAEFLNAQPVYFVKDQRLTKKVIPTANGLFKHDGSIKGDGKPVEVNTVRNYANDLRNQISQNKEYEQKLTQSLDASLRKRFKEYQTILPESEYKERFQHVLKKYQALQECGIYQDDLEPTEYEGDERRFFSLNLEDWEKRTALYDDLMARIKVFVETLTGKSLTNKRVAINAGEGISFTTLGGKQLEYASLSSGEQNETILLYELLFNSKPESLVLIDEPETSLHVAWQIEFFKDLEKIRELTPLSFIVATHSPDIINDKMDLSIDLHTLAHGEQDGII